MVFEDKSSLFFIQNKYWTFIFLAVGLFGAFFEIKDYFVSM